MTEAITAPAVVTESEKVENLQPTQPVRVPQYRRDLFPKNIVLSAEDLCEFCELLAEANERAKSLEFNNLNLTQFESVEQAKEKVNEFVPLEYNALATNGDSVKGLGIPSTEERAFPDELKSFFISNASYAQRAINIRPLNAVEVFLDFEKPTLKIDLQTLPSNPTNNRSVINVSGRDEDWVISTADRIQSFFNKRRAFRPAIHGSGTYDYLVFLIYLPICMWLFHKNSPKASEWLATQSIFLNVILGIYTFCLPSRICG